MKKAFFNWSGGKDSALALYKVLQAGELDIKYLLTNVSRDYERISMHGVPKSLLLQQVEKLKLNVDLELTELWEGMSMEDYSQLMQAKTHFFKEQEIDTAIFGDIFLEDLRTYREDKLGSVGVEVFFPLWQNDTKALVEEFIDLGFKAVVVAANARLLDQSFMGRVLDKEFLKDLPEEVDPCGENGEFHSFVYDGPIFEESISFQLGEIVLKEYETNGDWDSHFWFQEIK